MKNLETLRTGVRYAAVPLTLATLAGCGEGQPKRPNILVMMTDDHTAQAMSRYGSLLVETQSGPPGARRDALRELLRLERHFGTLAARILTGKYSHVNGFTDNSRTFDGDQQTFPKLLHAAGYQTAMIGKWHLNSGPAGLRFLEHPRRTGRMLRAAVHRKTARSASRRATSRTSSPTRRFRSSKGARPLAALCDALLPQGAAPQLDAGAAPPGDERRTGLRAVQPAGRLCGTRECRAQAMEIGRDMWPEWDLNADDARATGAVLRAGDDGRREQRRRVACERLAEQRQQYQAAYNRMTDAEKARWNEAYAPRIAEYEQLKRTATPEEMTRWKYQQYMKDYCAVIKAVDENVGRLLDYLEQIGEPGQHDHRLHVGPGLLPGRTLAGSTSASCTRSASARRCWCATRRPWRPDAEPGAGHEHRPGADVRRDGRASGSRRHAGTFAARGADLGRQGSPRVAHGVYYHYYEYPRGTP